VCKLRGGTFISKYIHNCQESTELESLEFRIRGTVLSLIKASLEKVKMKVWDSKKSCTPVQEGCCTVLEMEESHMQNILGGIHDLCHIVPTHSKSTLLHSFTVSSTLTYILLLKSVQEIFVHSVVTELVFMLCFIIVRLNDNCVKFSLING
jgi:hypothetical protein